MQRSWTTMQMLCEKVRQLEEVIWKEEQQYGKHIPGYGGFIPLEEDSPANDVLLPRYHIPDMEEWGGKQPGYAGHKPLRPCHENPEYMWNLDHSRNHPYTTTYGHTNLMTQKFMARLKKRPPIIRPPWPHEDPKARKGIQGFFQDAGDDPRVGTSEEGKIETGGCAYPVIPRYCLLFLRNCDAPHLASDAQKQGEKFYAHVRPYEGTLLAMNSSRSIKSAVMQ